MDKQSSKTDDLETDHPNSQYNPEFKLGLDDKHQSMASKRTPTIHFILPSIIPLNKEKNPTSLSLEKKHEPDDFSSREKKQILDRTKYGEVELRSYTNISLDKVVTLDAEKYPSSKNNKNRMGMIGRYELIRVLGEGGMGTVYEAWQTSPVTRQLALKLIRADKSLASLAERFRTEMQTLALMDHPQIARILDAGTSDKGEPYFVMELIPDGQAITDFADKHCLTIRERIQLFITVCQGVQHAHQKGIIHRDLKPSNILVGWYDEKVVAKIIDFGVAKVIRENSQGEENTQTDCGTVIGTLEYMSPEQAANGVKDIDTRSDVYALGVILCELFTGTTPFGNRLRDMSFLSGLQLITTAETVSLVELLSKDSWDAQAKKCRLDRSRLRSYLSGELNWIVLKALAKDRNSRYSSAAEMVVDLQHYLNGEPISAHPPSRLYQFRKMVVKYRWAFSLVASIMVLMFVTTLFMIWQQQKTLELKTIADQLRQIAQDQKIESDLQRELAEQHRQQAENASRVAQKQRKIAEQNLTQMSRGFEILSSLLAQSDEGRHEEITGEELKKQIITRLEEMVEKLHDEEQQGNMEIVARVKNTLGRTLLWLGNSKVAVQMLEKMKANLEKELGNNHEQVLRCMYHLGLAYQANGAIKSAIQIGEECLARYQKQFGKDHINSLAVMNNLANSYLEDVQVIRAISLLEECLVLEQSKLGKDHPNSLATLNNLARAYRMDGQIKRAISIFQECLALEMNRLEKTHPLILTTMNNLAAAYIENGQLKQALPLLEECLRKQQNKFGKGHPKTFTSMNNLAFAYFGAGKVKLAISIYEECLRLEKSKLGEDHPQYLNTFENLAVAYRNDGQVNLAIAMLEECLTRRNKIVDKDHPYVATTLGNLAETYQQAGQLDRAIPLYEKSLTILKSRLGNDHQATLAAMGSLAVAYQNGGNLKEAISMLENLLEMQKRKFAKNHPAILSTMNSLARAYHIGNQKSTTLEIYEQCLALKKKKLGDDHPETLITQNNLAQLYHEAGQLNRATQLLKDCLALMLNRTGKDNPTTVTVQNNLALAYQEGCQFNQAIVLFEDCLIYQKSKLGNNNPQTLETMRCLAQCYQEVEKLPKAILLFENYLEIRKKENLSNDIQIASCQVDLGAAYLQMKEYEKAEKVLRSSLQTVQIRFPQAWLIGYIKSVLGASLMGQKRMNEAEPFLREGYEHLVQKRKDIPSNCSKNEKYRIAEARNRLIEFYELKGDKKKAEQLKIITREEEKLDEPKK